MIYREFQLSQAQRFLKRTCTHDAATGLPNARWIDEHAFQITEGEVLLCSLDRFRVLNENFGRPFMNDVLLVLGQRLQAIPSVRHLCRIGGDEFAIILDAKAATGVDSVMREVTRTFRLHDRNVDMTATLGRSTLTPGLGLAEVLRRTEMAVLHGKGHGRNQIVTFHPRVDNRRHPISPSKLH